MGRSEQAEDSRLSAHSTAALASQAELQLRVGLEDLFAKTSTLPVFAELLDQHAHTYKTGETLRIGLRAGADQ